MSRVAMVLMLVGVAASPARAAVYFVSTQGSDANSCEAAQGPAEWDQRQSIASALECLSPGDTLYIHGGTYTGWNNVIDSQSFFVPSGTPWAQVTITAYPGEQVTLQPPHNVSAIRLTSRVQYLTFRDFAIDMSSSAPGADASGIFLMGAQYATFERLDVRNSPAFGVHFGHGSAFNAMLNCRVYDNGYYGGDTTNGHGLYISSSGNLFEGNEVYNNQGYGFHVYGNWGSHGEPSYNILRHNRIHGNGIHGAPGFGMVFAWGHGNVAHDNLIYNNAGGVQLYTDATATNIHNNTIVYNGAEGVALQYYGPDNVVSGNRIYGNVVDVQDYGGWGPSAYVENNVVGF